MVIRLTTRASPLIAVAAAVLWYICTFHDDQGMKGKVVVRR